MLQPERNTIMFYKLGLETVTTDPLQMGHCFPWLDCDVKIGQAYNYLQNTMASLPTFSSPLSHIGNSTAMSFYRTCHQGTVQHTLARELFHPVRREDRRILKRIISCLDAGHLIKFKRVLILST